MKRPCGRPRVRPANLHADKGYDFSRCRAYLRQRGIACRIARRGIESSERLGALPLGRGENVRLAQPLQTLPIRYERLADIHLAFLDLGCALICLRSLQHES